jgi:hypothetical protein
MFPNMLKVSKENVCAPKIDDISDMTENIFSFVKFKPGKIKFPMW